MFRAIKKWWFEQKAARGIRKVLASPLCHHLANSLCDALYTDKTYLGKFLSDNNKVTLFNNAMTDIHAILSSDDPVLKCREYICNNVVELACFRIPTIKMSPSEDGSGFRGLPGITGEIYQHINDLVKIDKTLKEYIWSRDVPDSVKNHCDYPFNAFVHRSSELEFYLNAANILRIHLDDYKPELDRDWFRKYIEIEFALRESMYRDSLEMPDVLEEQSQLGACSRLFYHAFYDYIIFGKQYPRFEWENLISRREQTKSQ